MTEFSVTPTEDGKYIVQISRQVRTLMRCEGTDEESLSMFLEESQALALVGAILARLLPEERRMSDAKSVAYLRERRAWPTPRDLHPNES